MGRRRISTDRGAWVHWNGGQAITDGSPDFSLSVTPVLMSSYRQTVDGRLRSQGGLLGDLRIGVVLAVGSNPTPAARLSDILDADESRLAGGRVDKSHPWQQRHRVFFPNRGHL